MTSSPRAFRTLRVITALVTLAFVTLVVLAQTPDAVAFNQAVRAGVQHHLRHPALEFPMRALTRLGSGQSLVLLSLLGWLVLRRLHHPLAPAVPAVLGVPSLVHLLSDALTAFSSVRLTRAGVPSGHALGATILFGAMIYIFWTLDLPRRWRWAGTLAAASLILGVAASRLYLDRHWLSDVLSGLMGGVAYLLLTYALVTHRRALRHVPPERRS